jgi:hypothetical protein
MAIVPGVSRSGATIVGGMLMRLDRAAAAEFSFFLSMPTMMAAFAADLVEVRDHLQPERAAEIAIGFVMAFLAALVVVKPFLGFVRRSGFGPFAWYRIAVGVALLVALAAGRVQRGADRCSGFAARSSPASSSPFRSSSALRRWCGSSVSLTVSRRRSRLGCSGVSSPGSGFS